MSNLTPSSSIPNSTGFQCIIPGISQMLNFTSSVAAISAQFQPQTTVIQVFASADCFIQMGSSPSALADGTCMFIPQGIYINLGCFAGTNFISVIQRTVDGILFITEGK